MSTLAGKVAVISGGTTGIGLAIAQRFVAEGAHVFIFGRRQAQLDQAAKLIGRNVTAKSVGARAQRSAFSLGARTGGFRRIGKFHHYLQCSSINK